MMIDAIRRKLGELFKRKGRALEEKLGEIREKVEKAQDAQRELRDKWREYLDYYGPDHQDEVIRAKIKEETLKDDVVTANHIFSTVETFAAVISQLPSAPYVVAEDNSQDEAAKQISLYLQAFKDLRRVQQEREERNRDAITTGTGCLKVFWDTETDDVTIRAISPLSVWVDPCATDIEYCSYIAIRSIYSRDLLERIYDGKDGRPKFDHEKAAAVNAVDPQDIQEQKLPEDAYELWEVYHEFGDSLFVYSGQQVFYDGENPTPGGIYPVFFFPMHASSQRFWGQSTVAYLTGLQDLMNKTRTRMYIHERLTTNPAVVCSDGAKPKIDTTPGAINYIEQGTEAKWMTPPPLPPSVFQTLVKAQQDFDTISGVHDITRGKREKGVVSGVALEALAAQSEVRLGAPVMNWVYTEALMWQTVLEYMAENYSETRRLVTASGGQPRNIWISQDAFGRKEQVLDEYGAQVINDETGEVEQERRLFGHRVVMQADAQLPLTPMAQAEVATRALQMTAGHPLEFDVFLFAWLDAVKFPNADQIKENLMKAQDAALKGQMTGSQMREQEAEAAQSAGMQQAARAELEQRLPPEYLEILDQAVQSGGQGIDPQVVSELLATLPERDAQLAASYLGPELLQLYLQAA